MRFETTHRGRRLRTAAAGLVVVAGLVGAGSASAVSPGALDTSFGSSGAVGFAGTQLFGVAGYSDGSTLVAGTSGGRVLVERLSTAGAVEAAYHGPAGYARAVAVAPDGKVAVTGTTGSAMFVARLTSALAPDPSFAGSGVVSAFSGQSGLGYAVAIGSDDSVVAAGSVSNSLGTESAIARYSATGAAQWTQVYSFGGNSVIRGVALQSNGAVVLAGSQNPGEITNGIVARLTAAGGALDSSFAGSGALTYSYPGSGYTAFQSLALQANGQIVAAGMAAEGPTTVLLRVNGNGTHDTGFGSGGAATVSAGRNDVDQSFPIGAYGVALGAGGTIVAAGNYEDSGVEIDQALYAFTSAGAPQGGFGSDGTVLMPTGTFEACGVAVLPSGNFVTVGNQVTTLPDATPCTPASGSAFAERFGGFGAVVFPAPPPPALAASLSRLPRRPTKKTVSRSGLPFTVSCNEGCRIQAELTASASTAKTLGIGKRTRRCTTRNHRRRCTTITKYSALTFAVTHTSLRSAGGKAFTLRDRTVQKALGKTRHTITLGLVITVASTVNSNRTTIKHTLVLH